MTPGIFDDMLGTSTDNNHVSDPGPTGDGVGQFLSLCHPKSDGCLYTATPVDPVFIMLPIFEEARMKKRDNPGKFRQLDEIMFITGYPGYQHLLLIAENSMQVVCEVKEIGSSKFFRLDDSKVLAWLYCKVCELKQSLPILDKNYAARQEKDTLADAVSILGEYVKDEPWLKLLCNHLKLNLVEATREAAGVEYLLAPSGSLATQTDIKLMLLSEGALYCTVYQGKGSDKKSTKSGKQAKKAKVETESKNIKEMFSRASRRRS
ncbi:Ribonuclease H2 subunit B [Morella rubra]|uniref:Ribonuclease H2 subunit B n=1 Tax=Morella rubra TaxID=262757 RepID=A0A6A1UVJ5_9ROSI|nr:Ribonuclease H2 subunit B [Morella rubra]